MALKKKIASKNIEVVKNKNASIKTPTKLAAPVKNDKKSFPVGTKYIYDKVEWKVVEIVNESNTEIRRCTSVKGDNEIIPLFSLLKDLRNGQLVFYEE